MFLGFHDNFRLAVLINFVLMKKRVYKKSRKNLENRGNCENMKRGQLKQGIYTGIRGELENKRKQRGGKAMKEKLGIQGFQ